MIRVLLAGYCILLGCLALGAPCYGDMVSVDRVTIVSGSDLDCYLKTRGGVTYISVPGTRGWALCGSADDYHAMPAACVEEAIRAITYPIQDLEVLVIILPVPRLEVTESSAEGRVIFLSPGRVAYPEEHIHYIVAHETGHVVQHLLMPESCRDLWEQYAALRGVRLDSDSPGTPHAWRLSEIFAEDFRALFGGEAARCGGNVENHDITAPGEVSGLKEFMLALLSEWEDRIRISAYPNPFTSEVVFEAFTLGETRRPIEVTVFDTLGRKVRELGRSDNGSVFLVWDGRDGGSRVVAPGVYFAEVVAGEDSRIQKVIRR